MEEPLTISKEAPEKKSMDYSLLREEGLKYIQNIGGKVWTDHNIHDPGITILEVLCYAITELGYRTSYDIKDIIARDPAKSNGEERHNFFTAAEILPNAPVTKNDYRKLMIDVEVEDSANSGCEFAGVKNAWIEQAKGPEIDVYLNKEESKLTYEPTPPGDEPLDLDILYNVLLEFDECEAYGDLNENKIVRDFTVTDQDNELEGLVIRVDVEFPRWDHQDIDWNYDVSLSQAIRDIEISFLNLEGNYSIDYELNQANKVVLSGTMTSTSGPETVDLSTMTTQLNQFIFEGPDSLITFYRKKIDKIKEIVNEVKTTLYANRNLCEDFLKFNALRIEEILVCADIELELDADVEETQARMYHEIAKFLSPTVYFYSLDEMFTRSYDEHQYDITSINIDSNAFTIDAELDPMPESGSTVAVTGSNNNNGTYTVQQARLNRDDETRTDIFVEETIPSGILTEGEKLYIGNPEEDQCRPTEKIFEGPLLDHGFIDDKELARADRKKKIHVSDLIQIIMDVPGVVAVKNIQIANDPQDNVGDKIKSETVRWCLDLAFDQNYVPRLNTDDSKITFYKDQLPYRADQQQVDEIIEDLENEERSQKRRNPVLDIEAPRGEYKNLEDYESIQNEFPLVYGIGEEGVPSNPGNPRDLPTEAHARQLKGFLMFFDQLLANFLSQLAHVKDLFSMNPEKDKFGNFKIGRTYYTQPLFDIVPNLDDDDLGLYVDQAGHEVTLNNIAESEEEFGDRRNRFLDHLMARFAEQFTDYALLTYRISGPKAQNELIEDKLAFLNSYPEISANRGQAFNYKDPCEIWHIDNVSGLEKRASMLVGIEERDISELSFSPRFKIKGSGSDITFSVENDDPKEVLTSSHSFETVDKAKEILEKVIVNGVYKEKFSVKTDEDSNYFFELICDDEVIAESVKKDFADETNAEQAIDEVVNLLAAEFFSNPESNRHNLAPPLDNYFDYSISPPDMVPDPPTYTIEYELYKAPFDFSADPVFSGSFEGEGDPKLQARVLNIDTGSSVFTVEGDIRGFLAAGDKVVVEDSEASDGIYTISSFSKNGDDTDIKVDETIPSDEAPRGELHYNQVSKEELKELAESKVYDVLWNVIANGVSRDRYVFDSSSPEYKFKLCDLSGNLLGESEASDFNVPVADEIENAADGVRISDDDQAYNVESTDVSGPNIEVEIDPAPSSPPSPGSQLYFTESFDLQEIDKEEQIFKAGVDLTEQLSNVNKIVISGSASNDGEYSILDVSFDGTHSLIKVREAIPSGTIDEEEDPMLEYTKSFEIIKAAGNKITIKGGADEQAVADIIDFLISKFADHEGMHLVEHILLRPKVHENLFVNAEEDTLEEGLAENGMLTFTKTYPIKSADRETKTFVIETDITSDLLDGMKLRISDSKLSDGEFTIDSFSFNGTSTEIVVEEPLVASIEESSDGGNLSYEIDEEISAVSADEKKITIPGYVASAIPTESILEITGSSGDKNDGRYTVLDATNEGSNTGITIKKVEDLIRDRLLAVNLGDECECVLEDPYTCVAHIVLPYWPGRFTNTDFRKFFDKTLRREAPAHVFLNICWVSPAHMADFERAYKTWLIENSRKEINKVALSKSLDELIDSIEKLRNVYPEGTLHDCDEDENLENSIILDHSRTG